MSENEILARGIVAGMAIVLPFLGIAIAQWHLWKGWSKDLEAQNYRLFMALKIAEDKTGVFESTLKHIENKCKPLKEADK